MEGRVFEVGTGKRRPTEIAVVEPATDELAILEDRRVKIGSLEDGKGKIAVDELRLFGVHVIEATMPEVQLLIVPERDRHTFNSMPQR
jgi:hypothetical protein